MSNSSIWPIDRTLSGVATSSQNGLGSDDNEGQVRIPQSSSITGASTADCWVSYPGHSLRESYLSAQMQSAYSTAPANWASPTMVAMPSSQTKLILLYFGLWPGQKCHSKVMHRKEVTHSNGSYERKSRGPKLADEMGRGKKNSHGTLIDWCTGREWPVNCMTVISAGWRSIIPFQKSSRLLSGRWIII